MSEDIKIYHVETQEDYDDLVIKLENEGYLWCSGKSPTSLPENTWSKYGDGFCLIVGETMSYSSISWCECNYKDIHIQKYKAKRSKEMEKVVVPQFVADWYEEHKSSSLYKTLYRYSNNVGMSCELSQWQDSFGKSFEENLNAVEEIIAKMHLYGYEVEEEKKYYWRKKKEYMLDFEPKNYINVNKCGRVIFTGIYKCKFTETEIRELVSEEDFNKLERVEIDDVQ